MGRGAATTVGLACLGTALGHASGLPMGQLLGAASLVLLAGRFGFALATPPGVIVLIQLILGVSVGALLDARLLGEMADPTVLVGLLICMSAQLAVGFAWLYRVEGWNRAESLLGAVPGAMAAVMTLTGEEGKSSAKMVFAHMVRTIALLVTVFVIAGPHGAAGGAAVLPDDAAWLGAPSGYVAFLPLAAGSFAAGRLLERVSMPAPYMITGLILTASVNLLRDGDPITVPEPLVILAMTLLGALIGIRLKDITGGDVVSYLRAGLVVTALAFGITLAMAVLVSELTGHPFLVLFMAWVPGGVEVMVAAALALGLEPAFVMLNHVLRMSALHLAPVFMRPETFRSTPKIVRRATQDGERDV